MTTVLIWAGVAICGGCGAVLRFLVDGLVARRSRLALPLGTLVVNSSGAVVLGLLTGVALDDNTSLVAGTAVVGSYTTFSTWMYESQRLAEERQLWPAAVNVILSVVAGVAAVAVGRWIAGAL